MTSIYFSPFCSDRVRVAALCVALLASAAVHANPANCDGDMTEDQRFQAELCSAHAGCRFVFGIADTCVKAKSFLSKLGLGGRGSATEVTDNRVSNALAESGVPPSGISSCLFDFDQTKCREYLSGGPKKPGAKEKADEIVERLKGKVYDTTVWDAGLGLAKEGLRMCDDATNEANMRDAVRAKERCALADGNINACLSTKQGHEELRRNLQGLIDGGELGADAAGYRSLASTPYPACPTTLPSSGKTPKVALADYLKFWDTPEESKSKKAEQTGGTDSIAGLLEKGVSQVEKGVSQIGDWFNNTFKSEQKPSASEEEQKTAREAGAWVDNNLADTQARAESEQAEKNRKAQEASARLESAREAERVANQTPAERITNGFDQRIASARQQCVANDSSCNSGCMAVAAVGVLSIFMARGSSASGAAGDQVQQCSNRCDQAKSSCEQEVSALEQEKAQAINGATRGPSMVSTNAATTGTTRANTVNAGGKGCREILESLVGPVNDGNPMNAAGSNLRYPLGQIYSDQVWASQIYVRVANTHPACANDQSSKDAVAASLRSTQGYCRQAESLRNGGPFNCITGQSYGGTAARTEAAIRQLFQQTSVAGGGAPARPPGGECKAAVAQQEADFTVINQRGKSTGAANSTIPSMQVGLYMMSERLKLLDQLCRGQPEYGGYASMKQSQASTMRACGQIATNSADCRPRVAW